MCVVRDRKAKAITFAFAFSIAQFYIEWENSNSTGFDVESTAPGTVVFTIPGFQKLSG